MSLIQALPEGPLDIIGDIHGEYQALLQLLQHLGYDEHGQHPAQRTIVFVGDFCDRGPDSPAVLALVERLVEAGRAVAVLGNHEMNLLLDDPKDGSGWYFDQRHETDQTRYAPFKRIADIEKANTVAFLSSLPIAMERQDLRIVHAAWISEHIETVRSLSASDFLARYDQWDNAAKAQAKAIEPLKHAEQEAWPFSLEDRTAEPPFLHAHADYDSVRQMMNPLKVLTSGVERKGRAPFYASGKWRFAERVQWWNEYVDAIPVVVGHYWRRFKPIDRLAIGKGDPDLFDGVEPDAWHGKRHNVFCVDFSVGGRWSARKGGKAVESDFKLAALRWPECEMQFDDGHTVQLDRPGQA
jgi:hypothetical protein